MATVTLNDAEGAGAAVKVNRTLPPSVTRSALAAMLTTGCTGVTGRSVSVSLSGAAVATGVDTGATGTTKILGIGIFMLVSLGFKVGVGTGVGTGGGVGVRVGVGVEVGAGVGETTTLTRVSHSTPSCTTSVSTLNSRR